MQTFTNQLLKEIISNKKNRHRDNYDPIMKYDADFNVPPPNFQERIFNLRVPIADNIKIARNSMDFIFPKRFYKTLLKQHEDFSYLYNLLEDNCSKQILLKILAYRILGYQRVKLPRNTSKYWDDINAVKKLKQEHSGIKIKFINLDLPLYDLNSIGFPIILNNNAQGLACIFVQRQYEYHGKNIIKPEKGDVVIDCGACWGDTALYFANEVGPNGKVYSFEFIPDNIDVFNLNISQNPSLVNRIHLIKHPVWNVSDVDLIYADHGPGSSVSLDGQGMVNPAHCKTLSIDDLVEQSKLEKVNFIKMDIEGAELNALRGAEKTIKRFKPKLAISAYHKPDDFVTLPAYINSLGINYQFYLNHHTIHKWETVLYAIPKE
jgi:FkbM family methyltransferase